MPRPEAGLIGYGRLAQGYRTHARGEVGSAYLGLLAIAGLAGLFVPLARGLLRGRRIPFTQGQGAVLWILAFSVVGGANGILGSLGVVLLRGTNRYSIWIVAVALLHLVKRLSRRPTGRPLALAAGLAVVAVLDQVPRLPEQGAAWRTRRGGGRPGVRGPARGRGARTGHGLHASGARLSRRRCGSPDA